MPFICINLMHEHHLTKEEYQKIQDFCKKYQLVIVSSNLAHFTEIKGEQNVLFNLFKTIPKELIPYISTVMGLNNDQRMKKYTKNLRQVSKPTLNQLNFLSYYGIPKTFNGKTINGSGQTIAIIELGGGYKKSDLDTYFKAMNLATPIIKNIFVDGATMDFSSLGEQAEVVLDIVMAGTFAPKATIVVYFAPNTVKGFYDAIYRAINDNINKPLAISISWGSVEIDWNKVDMIAYNKLFGNAVSKYINVCVASGNRGSSDGYIDGKLHVDFPASSQYVVACGGTSVRSFTNKNLEVVWNNSKGRATGGGFSAFFSKPTWQNGLGRNPSTFRGVPDVSANADSKYGYSIVLNGKFYVVGGTSAVAPIWAAIVALLNQSNNGVSVGFINTKIYANKNSMKDITYGNNTTNGLNLYKATIGWDPCTGCGSINGPALFELFK